MLCCSDQQWEKRLWGNFSKQAHLPNSCIPRPLALSGTCPRRIPLRLLQGSGPTHTLAPLPRPPAKRQPYWALVAQLINCNPGCDANPRLVLLPASVCPVLDGAIRAALWGRDHSCIEPSILIDNMTYFHHESLSLNYTDITPRDTLAGDSG